MTAALPVTCPTWCRQHDVVPEPDGSVLVVHLGAPLDADGRVQLRQGVHLETDGRAETTPPAVVLDGDELPVDDARQLIAALALATLQAGAR